MISTNFISTTVDLPKNSCSKETDKSVEQLSIAETRPSRSEINQTSQAIAINETSVNRDVSRIRETTSETVDNERKEENKKLKKKRQRLIFSSVSLFLVSVGLVIFQMFSAVILSSLFLPILLAFLALWVLFVILTGVFLWSYFRENKGVKLSIKKLFTSNALETYALIAGIISLALVLLTGLFGFGVIFGWIYLFYASGGLLQNLSYFILLFSYAGISVTPFLYLLTLLTGLFAQLSRFKKSKRARIGFWLNVISIVLAAIPILGVAALIITLFVLNLLSMV